MESEKPDVLFVLSIDTEEEWNWDKSLPENNFSVKNIQKIPSFQAFCDSLGVRPTYFVDYAVAENPESFETLKSSIVNNRCEIGAHLHPWCNPPFYGKTEEKDSHVVNLPIDQVEKKLDALLLLLNRRFGVKPNSFRTGRWGINREVLQLLVKKNIQIDSSMYPFFKNEFFNCESTTRIPYWPDFLQPTDPGAQRNLLEIPVTVGFNRKNFDLLNRIYKTFSSRLFDPLHIIGILWHTKLLRKLYLSPEINSGENMRPLIDAALQNEHPVIHMYLHSSSLMDRSTGLMNQDNALEVICSNIQYAIDYIKQKANIKFCTITEASNIVQYRLNHR